MAFSSQSSNRGTVFLGTEGFKLTLDQPPTNDETSLSTSRLHGKQTSVRGRGKLNASTYLSPTLLIPEKASYKVLVPITAGDPFLVYQDRYQVQLDGPVVVCQKKPATLQGFGVRKISGPDAEQKLHMLSRIHHENFLHFYEIFAFEGIFYTISEHMAVSCEDLVSYPEPIEEVHLATIFCQVGAIRNPWEKLAKD